MEFVNKEYFFLLLLLIPYIIWYMLYRKKTEPTMRMSDTFAYQYAPKSWRVRLKELPFLLRIFTFVMVVMVLARPQTHNRWGSQTVEGIDIMLAIDVSTSMLAEDLKPNRIEAAKSVAAEFIADRPDDNIGLTIFAGEAFTQCPMTTDHASLINLLQNVRTDISYNGIISDGTAIGMGLAGIKIHPDIQGVDIDDPRLFRLYEIMEGRIPLYLHMGDDRPQYRFSEPKKLAHVLRCFPRLEAVAAHLGGYKAADEAIEFLAGNDRVWYDTSSALWYLTPERAGEIIRALNPEKVMFGTDYPVKNPAGELERFFAIPGLTEKEQEDILWNNAVRFLHLEEAAKALGL